MKSFVCQDYSLNDAVYSAWIKAEKPEKFQIKILEHGVASWLWWKRKKYKIVLLYQFEEETYNPSYKKMQPAQKKHFPKTPTINEDSFSSKKEISHNPNSAPNAQIKEVIWNQEMSNFILQLTKKIISNFNLELSLLRFNIDQEKLNLYFSQKDIERDSNYEYLIAAITTLTFEHLKIKYSAASKKCRIYVFYE